MFSYRNQISYPLLPASKKILVMLSTSKQSKARFQFILAGLHRKYAAYIGGAPLNPLSRQEFAKQLGVSLGSLNAALRDVVIETAHGPVQAKKLFTNRIRKPYGVTV